ncbi:hypothetical protein FOZ63_004813, partial [Perkinsus olseni]
MTTVISQISKLFDRTSRLAYAAKKVNALGPQCKAEYLDSRMILSRVADHYIATWEEPETPKSFSLWIYGNKTMSFKFVDGGRIEKVTGPLEMIRDKFARVNPFAYLMGDLRAAFAGVMDDTKCSALIDHIEKHPTREYKDSNDWVRKFVHDRMNEAMKLAEDHRRKNNPLAYREQSFAMGEKIDFTRDSVYTISATVQNDENNNSQLLN